MKTYNRRMKTNRYGTWLIGLVLLLVDQVLPKLTVAPTNIFVLAGQSMELTCSGADLIWRYNQYNYRSVARNDKDIYINHAVQKEFRRKGFKADRNEALNEVNLSIENVTVDMAGEYVCRNDYEILKSVKLTVFANVPVCQLFSVIDDIIQDDSFGRKTNFIGPNTCGTPPDQILVSCSLTYTGNDAPVIELRFLRDKILIRSCSDIYTVVDEKTGLRRVTCNATMAADIHLDGTQFICQTNHSAENQYNCTTDPLSISYSFHGDHSKHKTAQPGDEVNCSADCSHPIGYKWTWPGETQQDVDVEYSKRTKSLNVTHTGSYRCEAKCRIGNLSCTVDVMNVDVTSNPSKHAGEPLPVESERHVGLLIGATIIAIILCIVAVLVAIFLLLRWRRRSPTRSTQVRSNGNVGLTETNESMLLRMESHAHNQ